MRVWVLFGTSTNDFKRALGRVIELVDEVPFQHVAIAIEFKSEMKPEEQIITVFESTYPRSRSMKLEEWRDHYSIKEMYEMPECKITDLIEHIYPQMEIEYSFIQLLMIFVSKQWARLQQILIDVNGTRQLICAELVANFLTPVYKVSFNEDEDYISLRDVRRVSREIGKPVSRIV